MTKYSLFFILFIAFYFSCKNESAVKTEPEQSTPVSSEPLKIKSAGDLLWLQGTWVSEDKSTIETWAVQGDSLAGNLYSASEKKIIDVLTIKGVGSSWVYISKTMQGDKGKNILMDLQKYSKGVLSFSNPVLDFPSGVEYALENDKTIKITVSGKNQDPTFYRMYKLD